MPMWSPPTPPQDDNDVYLDPTVCFLYEATVMPESHLPPIYVKKEQKRIRIDGAAAGRKHKVRKDDQPRVPRSLFDRPSKLLKLKQHQGMLKSFGKPAPMMGRPMLEAGHDHPEWLIHEDWALLQAVKNLLELPLTLATNSPAHIPNWDLVADVVNAASRTYRSAKQCRARYEGTIVPREEGRILYDTNPRKQKKTKGIYNKVNYKTKNNRPMRTSQLFGQDNNNSISMSFTLRFDSVKGIASKRTPTLRPTLANPSLKNPKHTAVLQESGINYESPLTPKQVADIRAERIAKEKKNQVAQAEQAAQRAQQQQQEAATAVVAPVVTAAVGGTPLAGVTAAGQMTIVQGTTVAVPTTASFVTTSLHKAIDMAVSQARLPPNSSFVVNAAPGAANAFATINKRMNQSAVAGTPTTVVTTTATLGALGQAVRTGVRSSVPQMTVQEIVTGQTATSRVAQPGTSTSQVITATTLTPAQIAAAQRQGTVTVAGATLPQLSQTTTRLTPQQLQYLKAQALLKQQNQRRQALTPQQAEQLKQQQLKRLAAQQAAAAQQGASTVVAGQKVVAAGAQAVSMSAGMVQKAVAVTTPLLTTVSGSQVTPAARLQTVKAGGKLATGASLQSEATLTLIQTSPQSVQTKLQPGQLLTGAQVQQVTAGTGGQPVATLVKTVTSQGGGSVPSVTIPVSAMSLANISVSVPQQKAGAAGKAMTQQLQQIRLQQLQQRKATQLPQGQKVATIAGSMGARPPVSLNTVQILPPPGSGKIPAAVTVQQIQQLVKQQAQQGQLPQIITSLPPGAVTSGVLASQILTTPISSLPRAAIPQTVTVTAVASGSHVGTVPVGSTAVQAGHTMTPTPATLVKQVQEVVVSPNKTVGTPAAMATQIKAMQGVRQVGAVSVATHGHQVSSATLRPSIAVQQAVQQVQAQAQQQAQQRFITPSVGSTVVVSQAAGATAGVVANPPTMVSATPVQPSGPGTAQDPKTGAPYTMRLRNPPKH